MHWTYARRRKYLDCEIRRELARTTRRPYMLILRRDDGGVLQMRFADIVAVLNEQADLERYLITTGWKLESYTREPASDFVH